MTLHVMLAMESKGNLRHVELGGIISETHYAGWKESVSHSVKSNSL